MLDNFPHREEKCLAFNQYYYEEDIQSEFFYAPMRFTRNYQMEPTKTYAVTVILLLSFNYRRAS